MDTHPKLAHPIVITDDGDLGAAQGGRAEGDRVGLYRGDRQRRGLLAVGARELIEGKRAIGYRARITTSVGGDDAMDADDTRDEAMRAELSPLRDAGDTTMETSLQQAIAPLLDRIAALEERFAALERATAADESSTLGRRHP